MSDDTTATQLLQTWTAWCRSLEASGRRLVEEDFPQSDRDLAEAFRHLGRLAILGWLLEVEFNEPAFPAFIRWMDDVTQWGGPNPDNSYLRANIDGRWSYRVVGNRASVHDFIISSSSGDFPHLFTLRTVDEVRAADICDADGSFELIVSAEKPAGTTPWLQMSEGAGFLNVRMYHYDWSQDIQGWMRIERIGADGDLPPTITPEVISQKVAGAARMTDDLLVSWKDFTHARNATPANTLAPAVKIDTGGTGSLAYGSGRWDLASGEALLIELTEPQASYWSMCVYDNERGQVPDWAWRETSINGAQAFVDGDRVIRIVVAHEDPGVPNWIDTTGYPAALLCDRYMDVRTTPSRTARVVKLADLAANLPSDHPRMDAMERKRRRAGRQHAMQRRFRG